MESEKKGIDLRLERGNTRIPAHIFQAIHVVSQIQVYVHHHTHAKLSCNEIANAIHYSVRQLNRIFAETSGETLYQYIARAKVSHIQELLTQGFSPAYISEELGYSSPASLTRFIRKWRSRGGYKIRKRSKEITN